MSPFYSRRNIIISIGITLAVVSVFLWYSYKNIHRALVETRAVNATLVSLRALEDVMDDIQNIEAGQRGYIISGKKEFLDPYYDGIRELTTDTSQLRELMTTYPKRSVELAEILRLAHRKLELTATSINIINKYGYDSARLRLAAGFGERVMDSIRQLVTRIETEDRQVLNHSNDSRSRAARTTGRLFVGLLFVFIIGIVVIYRRTAKAWQKRSAYEKQIAYLADLTERTSDAFFSTDLQGRIISWNNGAEKIYGYTREEAIGQLAPVLTHRGNAEAEMEALARSIAVAGIQDIEETNYHKNGEPIYCLSSVTPLRESQGQITGYVIVQRDITERKKASQFIQTFNEELARQVEEQTLLLKNVMERVSDGFCSLDENWNFTYINKKGAELTGLRQENLIGKNVWEVFPEAIDYPVHTAYITAFEQQQNMEVEFFYAPLDKWFVQHVYPSPSGLSIFFRDVTLIRNAERELKASNERFEMISRTTNDAIWEWNLETGETWGSALHQRLYGLGVNDPVPPVTEWENRIHPDDRARVVAKQAEALASDANVFITEYRFLTAPDGYRDIYDRCYIVRNEAGKPVRILGSMMDITASKEIATALQQSEEKYRTMIEQATDGIFILDSNGRYIEVNPAGLAMIGYTSEEIATLSAFDLMPAGEIPITENRSAELADGSSLILERRYRRKDGTIRDAEVSYKLLSNGYYLAIMRDITDKKKIEDELFRSNARFQIVSKATSDIVWDWDLRDNNLWWNDNYYTNLGYPKKDALENIESWYTHIHPEDVDRVRETMNRAINGTGSTWRDEYRYGTADGRFCHFLDRGFIIRDRNGKAIRVIGSMVDMSPIYNAQKELKESEIRLRTIMETDPECIKLLNRDCTVIDMNPAGLKMIGVDNMSDIKNKSLIPVIAPQHLDAVVGLVENAFEGRQGRLEFEMITFRKTHRWCEINIVPFRNAEGNIIHALGVTRDISERKHAEEALRANEEKYRTVIEQAIDAIALYDANGAILDVNTGSVNLLGYSKEELTGMKLSDVLTNDEFINNPVRYDQLQDGKSTVKFRRMRKKDGSVVETEVRSQQLPDGRFLSVIRDLTERIRAERELAASYEAIRKLTSHLQDIREEERTNIAREIHDELGQQLTVLKMDVSWLKKKLNHPDDQTREKLQDLLTMLDQIVQSVRRISSELRPSLLDDLGLVAAMEWQLSEFEKRSGIATSLVCHGNESQIPGAVKTALFRIFQESLTNVARHSDASRVIVTLSEEDDQLFLSILDNGRGFDKQKIADKRTLGILGMKERITMIGGEYEIRSHIGKGSEVLVRVPLNQTKPTTV